MRVTLIWFDETVVYIFREGVNRQSEMYITSSLIFIATKLYYELPIWVYFKINSYFSSAAAVSLRFEFQLSISPPAKTKTKDTCFHSFRETKKRNVIQTSTGPMV